MVNEQDFPFGAIVKSVLFGAVLTCAGTAMAETTPAAAPAVVSHVTFPSAVGNRFAYQLFTGRWRNNIAEWYYNPLWQPGGLTTDQVLVAIARAALKWSDVCNIRFRYNGLTNAIPDIYTTNYSQIDGISTIGWLPFGGTLSGADAYTLFWYANYGGTAYIDDSDVALNIYAQPTFSPARLDDLDGLLTQQMGYFIGIANSDNPSSILYNNPYHTYAYMRTLRGDDVAACVSVYGDTPLTGINRIFNWAEAVFPDVLAPAGRLTQQLAGFNYRYFEATNVYIGEQGGIIYYLLPGGAITPFGSVTDLLPMAAAAGF